MSEKSESEIQNTRNMAIVLICVSFFGALFVGPWVESFFDIRPIKWEKHIYHPGPDGKRLPVDPDTFYLISVQPDGRQVARASTSEKSCKDELKTLSLPGVCVTGRAWSAYESER